MPAPRGSHQDNRIGQLLSAVAHYIDSVTGTFTINAGTVLRVDASGVDGTALPGRWDLPFLTIAHALTHAVDGDTIVIGPGTFAAPAAIPNTLASLYIVGAGMYSTRISGGAAPAITWTAAGTVMTRFQIRNLSLVTTTGVPLVIDGTLQPTSFDNSVTTGNCLLLDHVYMSASAAAVAATVNVTNGVVLQDCVTPAADQITFTTVASVSMRDCVTGLLEFHVQAADAVHPSLTILPKYLYGCRFNGLTAHDLEWIICDTDCICDGAITFNALDDATHGPGGGNILSVLEFHGVCNGDMVLTHNLTLGARTVFVCDRCKLVGTFSSIGAGNLGTANLRNAVLYTSGVGNITTGANNVLDLIGAQFDHTLTTLAGAGTCNRSYFSAVLAAALGANVFDFTTVGTVDYPDANYTVVVEAVQAGDDPIVTHKAVTHCDITVATGGANITVTILHE